MGGHRRAWLERADLDLAGRQESLGSRLLQCEGDSVGLLSALLEALGNPLLVCEDIPAPEERRMLGALRARGARVRTVWQSTLLDPECLPFDADEDPDTFSVFRQRIEKVAPAGHLAAAAPIPAPQTLPPLPSAALFDAWQERQRGRTVSGPSALPDDPRSAFPCTQPTFDGGERAALAHLRRYCERGLPHTYKSTRNGLVGSDYSSKWSPWLATGEMAGIPASEIDLIIVASIDTGFHFSQYRLPDPEPAGQQ